MPRRTHVHLETGADLLTPRQRQIVKLLTNGATKCEAGVALGMANDTVRAHLVKARRRLGANSTEHLVALAMKPTWPTPPGGRGWCGRGKEGVPVAGLRDAFLRSGRSLSDIAREMGWYRPDVARVARTLGLAGYGDRRHLAPRARVSLELAETLCRAIGADPVDVPGL